jgi:Bacteriophage HK97-gp10, putative tail-component
MATVEGIAALRRRLEAIGHPRPLLKAIQVAAVSEAQERVPRKTGHLQRSIVRGALTDDHAIVSAKTPYAAAVEFGSKPHRIPKVGNAKRPIPIGMSKRLSGRGRTGSGRAILPGYGKGGMPTHAWHVNHPGAKAQPYLIPGAKAAVEKGGAEDIIVKLWNGAA